MENKVLIGLLFTLLMGVVSAGEGLEINPPYPAILGQQQCLRSS
jgi:hypothetical protein